MLDTVKDAFEMLKEEQEESGQCDVEIDGMTGFIFCSRFGNVPNPQSVNRAIKRIIADYNATEEVAAKKQHREAVCYLISRRITCGTLFAQGFAKTKQT